MFKKRVVLLLATIALATLTLTGCGYKGALYIPQAPEQATPDVKPDEAKSSSEAPSLPASTSGESH